MAPGKQRTASEIEENTRRLRATLMHIEDEIAQASASRARDAAELRRFLESISDNVLYARFK